MQLQVCGIQGVSRGYSGSTEEAKIFILLEKSQDVLVTRSSSSVNIHPCMACGDIMAVLVAIIEEHMLNVLAVALRK